MIKLSEIDLVRKEADERISLIRKRDAVIAYVSENKIKGGPKVINPDPRGWILSFPQTYQEGRMMYSPEQFDQFDSAINFANQQMDRFIDVLIEGAISYAQNHPEKILSNSLFWEPITVNWETYALPIFLNSSRLGKRIYVKNQIDLDSFMHLKFAGMGFKIIDIDGNLTPFFMGTHCESGSPQRVLEEMKKLNQTDLENHISDYYQRYPHDLPSHLWGYWNIFG